MRKTVNHISHNLNDGFVFAGTEKELLNLVLECIQRDVVFSGDVYDLRCSHIVKDSKNLIILASEGLKPITVSWEDGDYKGISLWNPYTLETVAVTGSMTIEPCDLWVMELEK